MTNHPRLSIVAALGAVALAAVACTPAEPDNDAAEDTTRTIVETREVPADPVVVEREVPVVVDGDEDRDTESTTIRANEDGFEVETTRDR